MLTSPTINSVHGRIRSITGTDPAANTEISETVPARRRWRLISLYVSLVADANVADRIPSLLITDGTNELFRSPTTTFVTADQTRRLQWISGQPLTQIGTFNQLPLPPDLLLSPGFTIETTTGSIQAGDNYSAPQLLVEEWIDP